MAQPANLLGPFAPPANYRFEDELQGDPPRPIPAELHDGRHGRAQRRVVVGWATAGLLCLLASVLPFVRTWGLYLLPLQYLHWIGLGCLVIATAAFLSQRWRHGPFRYVEEGTPVVALVRALDVRPMVVHGQAAGFQFVAMVEYRDPATGALTLTQTGSTGFSGDSKDNLTTTFGVGDYVTLVTLPGAEPRLYAFLDLRPGVGLVPRDGAAPASPWKALLFVAVMFGLFGALGWCVYALGRYGPVEFTFADQGPPMIAGAALVGLAGLTAVIWRRARKERQRAEQIREAAARGEAVEPAAAQPRRPGEWFGLTCAVLVCTAGVLGLGAILALGVGLTVNALLDDSPPQPRPVSIDQCVVTTHKFIFREYKIEYRFLDDPAEKHDRLATPDEIEEFQVPLGVADVHAGWLGWRWVKDIRPIRLAQPRPAGLPPQQN